MKISKCNCCSKIHLEAGNILIHFPSIQQLKIYSDYLESIDVAFYAAINKNRLTSKSIVIPLGDETSVNMAFTVSEFEILKRTIRDYLSGGTSLCESYVSCNELESLHLN